MNHTRRQSQKAVSPRESSYVGGWGVPTSQAGMFSPGAVGQPPSLGAQTVHGVAQLAEGPEGPKARPLNPRTIELLLGRFEWHRTIPPETELYSNTGHKRIDVF